MRVILLFLTTLAAGAGAVSLGHAQALVTPSPPVNPFLQSTVLPSRPSGNESSSLNFADHQPLRRTYWKEGAIAGAIVSAALAQAFLSLADAGQYSGWERARFTVVMAFPGAVVGALIGGSFRKDSS